MRAERPSQVNESIRRALRDGAATYEERGILVTTSLEATTALATHEPVLDQALYTIFRGLPARLMPGATLLVATHDRAGGDVELVWEAREMEQQGDPARLPLERGPYGDLLELALAGLQEFCRVRAGLQEDAPTPSTSSNFLRLAPNVRRRYVFLIPPLRREPDWHPLRRS